VLLSGNVIYFIVWRCHLSCHLGSHLVVIWYCPLDRHLICYLVMSSGVVIWIVSWIVLLVVISVTEPHHFYAAPDPGKNFDAAPAAPAPAPTLLYSKAKFLKRTKV
jgi:hypothetical protein